MNIRFEKRLTYPKLLIPIILIISIISSFIVMGVVFIVISIDPLAAYREIYLGAFEDWYTFSEVLVKATPLIFTGLAVALALKMRLWNIGAEGQLYMGAFGATWAAQTFNNLPGSILLPLVIVCGLAAGVFWGLIVGFLKERLNVNEILTSLLLNYVAMFWVDYLVYGPWRDPRVPGFPITEFFVRGARFPQFLNTRLHPGLLIALVLAVILWVVIEKTKWGYEIKATGESQEAARSAGMNIRRNIIFVFMICGGLAGLAGMSEIAGIQHKLQPGGISSGYGYMGIIIGWLANANPLGVVIVSFITAAILVGADSLKITMQVSSDMVLVLIGTIMFFLLIGNFFCRYSIRIKK